MKALTMPCLSCRGLPRQNFFYRIKVDISLNEQFLFGYSQCVEIKLVIRAQEIKGIFLNGKCKIIIAEL